MISIAALLQGAGAALAKLERRRSAYHQPDIRLQVANRRRADRDRAH
ncbi:hypothetical protein [Phenylobacterium sp.]|nr:hypothetical protein [Phenylobacterium sp.]